MSELPRSTKRPKLLIFDLDGTLVDSRADIVRAASAALRLCGYSSPSEAEILGFVGDGARHLIEGCLRLCAAQNGSAKDLAESEIDRVQAQFAESYCADPVSLTPWLGNIDEFLKTQAKTYRFALCTNKPRRATEAVLKGLKADGYFEYLSCGDDSPIRKPRPEPLLKILEKLGIKAEDSLMVGDGPQDIQAATAAMIPSLWVKEGMILQLSRMAGVGPSYELDSLSQFPAWLEAEFG